MIRGFGVALICMVLVAGCSRATGTPDGAIHSGATSARESAPTSKPKTAAESQLALPPEYRLLGTKITVEIEKYGPPARKYDYEGGIVYEFTQVPDEAYIADPDGEIQEVVLRGKGRTVSGVALGMTPSEIATALGQPASTGRDPESGHWYVDYIEKATSQPSNHD